MTFKETIRKILEGAILNEGKSVPNNPKLWASSLAWAKRRYKVCPSAYCNGAAAKRYKSKGGTWRTKKSLKESESLDLYYAENNINPDKLFYLGGGENGSAYEIDNKRVLKKTRSKSEYEFNKFLLDNSGKGILNSFIKVYSVDEVDGEYYIIMENLDMPPKLETYYYKLIDILSENDLNIEDLHLLNYDNYNLDQDFINYIEDFKDILRAYKYLNITRPDISPDNLGYRVNGKLIALDIDQKK